MLTKILQDIRTRRRKGSGETETPQTATLKKELRTTSATFRKKTGRHVLRTKDAIYCAFSTPRITIHRHEAQRDAERRLNRFGIMPDMVEGRRVLDLGCNNGAMLFQLANYHPAYALGVEYDADKIAIAQHITRLNEFKNLEFLVADIDELHASQLGGPFDIVLCLALEAHVLRPDRLYALLSRVTRGVLYFEANGSANPDGIKKNLRSAGFEHVRYLGFCDDDVVRSNNCRPLFTARKG